MPWKVIERKCMMADGAEGGFAVVKETDGSEVGCHMTKDSAEAHVKALYAQAGNEEKSFVSTTFKALQADKQIAFGEVYAPGVIDSHGDMMTAEQIEKTAHRFLRLQLTDRVDIMHDNKLVDASVVESFIAREGDPDFVPGSWVVGMKVADLATWERIKRGELNGFSFEAFVKKIPATVEFEYEPVVAGETLEADDHKHAYAIEVSEDGLITAGQTSKDHEHTHSILKYVMTEKSSGHTHRYAVN